MMVTLAHEGADHETMFDNRSLAFFYSLIGSVGKDLLRTIIRTKHIKPWLKISKF